jgi:proline iminopeptidase
MKKLLLLLLTIIPFTGTGQKTKSFFNGSFELFYEEFGKGPALYILSGGPGEAPNRPYRQIIDSLKSIYTCVLLHQRGSGKSKNIPINEETISIKNYLGDIELLRKKRGDKSVSLLGMSWGGLLAMGYAAEYPASVSQLFLICSAPPSYKLWEVLFDNQFARRSSAEIDSMNALQKIFSTKTERELDSLKHSDPSSKEVLAYKAFMAIHVRAMYYDRSRIPYQHFDELFNEFNFQPIPIIDKEVMETRWDITAKLKKLNTPALIIYGRQDDQGESTFYLQKECLRNSEMAVIEKCGHEILDEQPEEFFRILMNYVRKNSR